MKDCNFYDIKEENYYKKIKIIDIFKKKCKKT